MMKVRLALALILFSTTSALAVDLLQETRDITCMGEEVQVLIDKKDRFIQVDSGEKIHEYSSVEFLDSGILLKNPESSIHAYLQLSPKNGAILIQGELRKFEENQCEDIGAGKLCRLQDEELTWTSERLAISGAQSNYDHKMSHYGVHPNDGTYFVALGSSHGIGLLDFGSKLNLISGAALRLSCTYL